MTQPGKVSGWGRSLAAFLICLCAVALAPGRVSGSEGAAEAPAASEPAEPTPAGESAGAPAAGEPAEPPPAAVPAAGAAGQPAFGGPLIRVGVGRGVPAATLSVEGPAQLLGPDGAVLAGVPAGAEVTVAPEGAGLRVTVGGLPPVTAAGPLRLVPGQGPDGAAPLIRYKGLRYRGEMEVRRAPAGGLTVINVLPLEQYLRGVVPREMPASWPQAALEAQAVAARTYALRMMASGRFAAEGFDVTDDTYSQVYGGADAEHPRTDAAVAATAGQVVTYQGQLIDAVFHSHSGGHTEDNEVVFTGGVPVPYLRGVEDYDLGAPYYRWEVTHTPEELAALLQVSPLTAGVGEPLRVEPAGKRGSGGRWSHWRIVGTKGEVTVTGEQLRQLLGLRSGPREVVVSRSAGSRGLTYSPGRAVTVRGAGGLTRTLRVEEVYVMGAGSPPAPRPAPAGGVAVQGSGPVAPAGDVVVVRGGGWGHGVGLSQWGARGLAEQGKTYTEILTHFYRGTRVEPYQP
nr:MAG: hypothetical protein DIU70_11785 [Bacillota bacterium]